MLLLSVAYPLLMSGIGKLAPGQGKGRTVSYQGKTVGFEQEGQQRLLHRRGTGDADDRATVRAQRHRELQVGHDALRRRKADPIDCMIAQHDPQHVGTRRNPACSGPCG